MFPHEHDIIIPFICLEFSLSIFGYDVSDSPGISFVQCLTHLIQEKQVLRLETFDRCTLGQQTGE